MKNYFEEKNKEVIKKIIKMAQVRNILIPKNWNKDSCNTIINQINITCPLCKKEVGHTTDVICVCEI